MRELKSPTEYLRSRPAKHGVLFYPGAGTDWGPLTLFGSHRQITKAICVDYAIREDEARAALSRLQGWRTTAMEALTPDYLGISRWEESWPGDPAAQRFAQPSNAFGFVCSVAGEAGTVELVFLATEATRTYSLLLERSIRPSVIVLQDHGFGLNWARFGGASPLYEASRPPEMLPAHLLVAENTLPWPGYGQASSYSHMSEQMHDHARAVFARAPPRER